mmetsp:Transcript_48357/g.108966  ORF Transcript_48357/g.108966 Transcript_48357/m.108966 type:complete len:228 (+) Transcript_48357:835-1518(+)
MHLPQIVESQSVPLVCRQGEVVEGFVVCLLHTHASDVHRPQIELRIRVAFLRCCFKELESLLVTERDPKPMHVHIAQAVLARGVPLGSTLPEIFESRGVVLLRPYPLSIHVAQLRVCSRIARECRLRIVAKGALVIDWHSTSTMIIDMAESECRIDGAFLGGMFIVLQHLVVSSAMFRAAGIVGGQSDFLDDSCGLLTILRPCDNPLSNWVVVHQRLLALFGRPHAQ